MLHQAGISKEFQDELMRHLISVIDDDESKDGIGYCNLPVKVISGKKVGKLQDSLVLITAIDNVKPNCYQQTASNIDPTYDHLTFYIKETYE